MKSRGLGFSQVVSTFWIFYFFYLKKAIKVQKCTKSKLGVFLMRYCDDREKKKGGEMMEEEAKGMMGGKWHSCL